MVKPLLQTLDNVVSIWPANSYSDTLYKVPIQNKFYIVITILKDEES